MSAPKEVIHEDTVKIGDNTKAPDYSFRIGGTRKYFVEAEAVGLHQGRAGSGFSAPPLRLVGQAAAIDPDGLRGVRGLRLPHQALEERFRHRAGPILDLPRLRG